MRANLTTLRSNVELALAGRVAAPFGYRDRKLVETVSTGISEIDSLAGGFPRGGLTEICGPPCSGRTTVLLSALASRTADAESCALIDGRDAFDPHTAAAAGVELKQLLWVRCRNLDQALRATDLLIQAGGFGFIALDLSDIAPETVRHVPLNAWFRFRRAVEDTPTVLVVLEQESNAKTCASLVLQMGGKSAHWSTTVETQGARFSQCAYAYLLDGTQVQPQLLHSRMQSINASHLLDRTASIRTSAETSSGTSVRTTSVGTFLDPFISNASSAKSFQTETVWSYFDSLPSDQKPK